ncbi:hypothetical protein CISIN_1g034892mg [Citrus sinensis]|uniref:Uncharacterized protein n=1 Tax=Citrus sinensis TaxID=2711 RepID=A0A067DJT8_CITSI|nr:hypothetical protein CISIN_1g034892mg [Citrus sinensis]
MYLLNKSQSYENDNFLEINKLYTPLTSGMVAILRSYLRYTNVLLHVVVEIVRENFFPQMGKPFEQKLIVYYYFAPLEFHH